MKKSKFKIVEGLMLFLSQKQHIFGLCFIISLIFITFAYKNSNLNAEDVNIENDSQLVRTFVKIIKVKKDYDIINIPDGYTEDDLNDSAADKYTTVYENNKLLSCQIDIEKIFGINESDRALNKNLDYLFSDFKNNIKYSIDLYGIDTDAKLVEEKALFKVYTSKKYNPNRKADVCTYDDNGNVLTGNENQSYDEDYILCDISRMQGSNNCSVFPNDNNDGSLKCTDYNIDGDAKKYCYSKDHICNKYKDTKNMVAIDKEFIDQYLEKRNVEKDNLGKYFYLFYKKSRPTDQEVKKIQDTVNCFQTFYNCDLAPYWNVEDVEEKLKDSGNNSITADEFVNVIIDGKGDNYYNNQIFKKIVNNSDVSLFVENTTERCCLKTNDKSCDYKLCFAEENKDNYVEYFKDSKIYKYIKDNTVRFFTRSVSNQTCKNYLPDCASVQTIIPLYEKIDEKINIKNSEEQNSLYNASKTSGATCLYAKGTNKNDKTEYSNKVEDKSKSYCSDLLMDENGKLKLKYENGLEKENGVQKDNCFLKSCIDLNDDELTAISGKSGIYCSPYRYLRDYDKIGVTLDLKFLPISDGKIVENYYCDSYDEQESDFVFKNGIDHEKKENCYLRRCVGLSKEVSTTESKKLKEKVPVLTEASEKRTNSLFEVILKNIDDYVSLNSDSDFSSIPNITIDKNQLEQYCENRAFFTKSDFVEDNLNLLSCSEFKGRTVKSAAYKDIASTKRKDLENFLCVNFQTIIKNDIKNAGDNNNEISFATDVFTTFNGNTDKISDNSMLPDFSFSSNFLTYSNADGRNICKGVDNTMMYVSGDIQNLESLNFEEILDSLTNNFLRTRCIFDLECSNSNDVTDGDCDNPIKCQFGSDEHWILKTDKNGETKLSNLKNFIRNSIEANIVNCADYGSEIETNTTSRIVDCKLNEFLYKGTKNYKDYEYIKQTYENCEEMFKILSNQNEADKMQDIQTFYNEEGKLFLPVPLKNDQYNYVSSSNKSDETRQSGVCNYEGHTKYNKLKTASVIGCYPLADDFAYIDISTDYYKQLKNSILKLHQVSKPKDFTFNYIPVLTRYIKIGNSNANCGERKGGPFKDKMAILTSGNIDTTGSFKYISNDKNTFLTAAGSDGGTNSHHKYGASRYGNNVCVFDYKDLGNCMANDFESGVADKGQIREALRDYSKFSCTYLYLYVPGCRVGDKNRPKDSTDINYIEQNKYEEIKNDSSIWNAVRPIVWPRPFPGGAFFPPLYYGVWINDVKTVSFSEFAKMFTNRVYNYGGSIKDYYAYDKDYDHGVLGAFGILSSYRGSVIRTDGKQDLFFNKNFYETLNNRYAFASDYYKGITNRQIIKNCGLSDVVSEKDGKFNENILKDEEQVKKITACLKKYDTNFLGQSPNQEPKSVNITVGGLGDVFEAPLKSTHGAPIGRQFQLSVRATVAIKKAFHNKGTKYEPFKIINYIGNQEEYNEKNINCYFDNYGFPISNLKYCRGIFTTKENVTNFDIYNDSDMKNFLPESQCLKLPLASAPQPYFNLATPYNTPSLFSPIFILTKYIKWDTTSTEVDFKSNGVSGVIANFFNPKLYFSYYFTADDNNDLFRNTKDNGTNNWSEVKVGETLQDKLSTLKFASTGTGSRVFKKSFAGKKSFILSDKGFYYPIMCVSTYIDTEIKSLNPVADQCDTKYKGPGDSCVLSDVENFVCVDRMVPTYDNIYMKLDKNFSFRKPYINATVFDKKQTTDDKYTDKNFALGGDVERNSKAINNKGFNQVQQFGLTFERSLCSQLDIEYFDYLEKLNMLAEDNEAQRAIYTTELEKINEVIKPNCMEAQGEVTYLDKIDITEGECEKSESSTVAADIPNGNILLPINGTNLYLQCANENKIGKIIDRIKIVKNPVADKGHKEICVSDSNFEEMIQANKEQKTFDYSINENQVVVFNSANSTNVEDNKCLLDSESRKNESCKIADYVYVEDKSLSDPIITDENTTSIFVSESDGSVYRVKKIDCTNVEKISDKDLANIYSFDNITLERIKYCYKGGYNYSGNVSKANGENDYSCKCMKKSVAATNHIFKNGIFSSRAINKRELGLCIDIDNAIPTCEAVSYKNPAAESSTSYEEQVKNMKFSKITALMSDLFKNNNGYEDERWEHIWRNKQKMFNSIGSYSGSSRFLGHAEFARYPYCDDEDSNNCFGKSKVSVGTCSGFYRDGTRKVLAECVKVGDKYEFKKTADSGECVPDSCAGVGYTEVFNDLNTNEESLLNNNKNNKNFTQAELASYSNVQNSLNAFNTTEHNGEISKETIDNRGLFNGFAAWKETQSDVVSVKQDAVACLAGYGPAGTNYIVHKFFPYIKNVEDSINFRDDFSVDTDERIINMNNLLNRQYDVFNELVSFSKNQTSVGGSLIQEIRTIARLGAGDFIYLHDNLPVRFCNQLGNWEESRDIYNNVLKNGDKNIDSVDLRYYSKNDYYTDLKKGKKYLNNTVLSKDNGIDVPVFERANVLFNDGVSDYNDSINTKYCERLFCQALSMDEVTASYGSYDIYEHEYKNEGYINNVGSSDGAYYVTLEVDRINKYTPWRHLGGANWEATSAPRNHSDELIKGKDSYDQSNRIIDNVLGINGTDKDPTKIMYLKKVNGVCDNKYGYYNRGTKFVLNSFNAQFETLKQKVLSQPGADNQTTVNVEEINATKIGGAKTTGYETPFRTCSSIGLWSGVYNSCYRACEMIDMYHTNFSNDRKYNTFRTGKNGDTNSSFNKEDYVSNGDVVSFNLYPSFDRFRINNDETVSFKITNENGQETNETYKLGDYLTGGASWPTTIVGLEKESETIVDHARNLRYVEVEGTCDTTNPYNKTFVSNVDPKDYTKSLRPKRRCYENGEWGPIENLCVLFNTCNELSLNIFDLSNLLLQKGDINKMNKIINKKLLAQADCLKPGSNKDCYNNIYNAAYINRGFETDGLPVENKTIQNSIKNEDKRKLFSDKSDTEINGIISGEFFTVNAGVHVNPTETKRSVYVPLNLKENDNNFAFTYADSNFSGCETNDGKESCFIDETKSAGYKNVDFYKMQCNFGADDSMPWKFTSPYLGNYVYPMICDKNSSLGTGSKALNRTRLFNNKNLKNNIDNLLMYVKESNFHVLSYLINEDNRSTMFRELTNCKQVSSDNDGCDEHDTRSYENQHDFSDFNVSLPISATENRELSSYQHITYCDERYFYNEAPTNKGSDTEYLYRPIVIECTKPTDSDSKKGKFTMLDIRVNSADQSSFSAEQCYPRYCGRHFSNTINNGLSDVSGSKFTGSTIQNNWTLSHNSEYEKNKGSYGEIEDDHKITGYMSNIIQCDKYTSKSRLNTKANNIEIDEAYVLNFEKSKNVDKGVYKMNNTVFTFYSAVKDGITDAAWIGKNYVKDISTVCETNEIDIKNGIFNGITIQNLILQHKLASLDLSVFKDGQVKFCDSLNDETLNDETSSNEKSDSNTASSSNASLSEKNNRCQTISEAVLASGETDTTKQGTTKTSTSTAFADKYCVPLACDGEVDLNALNGFTDPHKNAKKIHLDYDKYQIGDYVIIENVAGDFTSVGNTTTPINGSNVYVMSTYLMDSEGKGVKTEDKTNNWYINQYQNGEAKEIVLNDTVDDAFGLVCQKDYDQYFVAGKVAEPTKESISEKIFDQCDLYIEDINMNEKEIKDKDESEINKHVKYTEILQNLINFVNKTSTITDETAKSKIDELLKTYIKNRINSIKESANGNFGGYVDYGNFANDSNIETIKETTIKKVGDSNKYYIFTGTQTVESSNTNSSVDTDNSQSNNTATTITYKYIVSADGNTKFSYEDMTCGSTNNTYLFETSLCDYNGKKYIKIEEHKSFKPSDNVIEISDGDEKVKLTYQSNEAMYILQDDFITEYKNAFENVYATYIEELLKDSTSVAKFYDNHADIQLINPNRFNGNEFAKYTAYEDLKGQLTDRYKSIEYLSDGLFTNDNIKDEIYKTIKGNSEGISVDLEKDKTIITLTVKAELDKSLSLYTLNNEKVDKHTKFIVGLKNYRDTGTIDALGSIEDWTNNIVIQLEKDFMTDIDSLSDFEDTATLKSRFGFTDEEIAQIKNATCANISGGCTDDNIDDNIAKRKIAKNIWSNKNTNNSIIENFEKGCETENTPGCDEANKEKVITIDMNSLDSTSSIEKFKPYIEKLVKANQILEGLYLKNYREKLINKDYIENNCVVFSDEKINACYQEKDGVCELLTGKSTSQFERLYIEEYQKSKGNASNAPFKKGLFMALQCGVDGKWKLVGGNNAVKCKKRCNDEQSVTLDPDGAGKYEITMKINNLRYGSSGSNEVAGVGMYCSLSNDDQSEHGAFNFACVDDNKGGVKLDFSKKTYHPGYHYHYRTWENPAEKSTCVSRLYYFGSNTSYYRTASLEGLKRNNSGIILTCPGSSNKQIIHRVMGGHLCCLDSGSGRKEEYPKCHDNENFECLQGLSVSNSWKNYNNTCDGKFNKTAVISYDIKVHR